MKVDISNNNFDLIRLLAAMQVSFLHTLYELSAQWGSFPIARFAEVFPGVPIFFFISGFLISLSFERARTLSDYFRNRGLRIYPALYVCVFINLLMVYATGYFSSVDADFFDVVLLYLAKTTFLQFYNPDFMRGFGDGVLNGSLWTICVELQFYILTPLVYWLISRVSSRSGANIILVALVLVSLLCNRLLYNLTEYQDSNYWKLGRVSFLPWFYMFAFGMLVQKNFNIFAKLLNRGALFVALSSYVMYAYIMRAAGFSMSNSVSPLIFFPLALVVFIAAFSFCGLAKTLLKGHDVSYGIYIYHVPVMNMFIFYNLADAFPYTLVALLISCLLAITSWVLIEKPCLRKKRRPPPVPSRLPTAN